MLVIVSYFKFDHGQDGRYSVQDAFPLSSLCLKCSV